MKFKTNATKPKPEISDEEKRRREHQRREATAASLGRPLLYNRRQTAFLLSISVAGVRRLELDGVLTPIKLDPNKTAGSTFHRADQVHALAHSQQGNADAA